MHKDLKLLKLPKNVIVKSCVNKNILYTGSQTFGIIQFFNVF